MYLVPPVVSAAAVAIASEHVWVVLELSLDLLSDDTLVLVQADGASWWSLKTSLTSWTWWAWWSLSAVDTADTSWTVRTLWTWRAWLTGGTGITSNTWSTSSAWGTWLTLLTSSAWLAVLAWVTRSTVWAVWSLLTWLAWSTAWAWLAWLTVLAWVTWGSVWAWWTSGTGLSHWTAALAVWTGWTLWTLLTWWTGWTWLSLSTVGSDVVGAETVSSVSTWLAWLTGGTVHTGSAWGAWGTWLAWHTDGTWETWSTHTAHWTGLLFALASTLSGSALWWVVRWESWALVVDLVQAISVLVVLLSSADSVSGGQKLLEEVKVWAAREASLLLGTLWGNGVDHNVNLGLSEGRRGSLNLAELRIGGGGAVLGNHTRVGHDDEDSSHSVAVLAVLEGGEGGVQTSVNVVTVSHVLGVGHGLSEGVLFSVADHSLLEVSDVHGGGGVFDDGNVDVNVLGVEFVNHLVSGGSHTLPVFLDTGGTVHEDNDFDWAWDWRGKLSWVAAFTLAIGEIHTAVRSDRSHISNNGVLSGISRDRQ